MYLLIVALCLVAWIISGCKTAPPENHGIPNFAQVDPQRNVWRGGQFDLEGLKYLQSIGIMRILKLNTRAESINDDSARALGMEVRDSPITVEQQLGLVKIEPQSVDTDISFIEQGNCFVHCGSDARSRSALDARLNAQGGQDRTGSIVYCYQRRVNHLTIDAAKSEMKSFNFHWELFGLKELTEDFVP